MMWVKSGRVNSFLHILGENIDSYILFLLEDKLKFKFRTRKKNSTLFSLFITHKCIFLLFCNIHLVWTGSGVLNTTSKNIWTSKNSSSNFSSKKQHSVSCMSTDICRLEDKCTFACFSPTTCIHDWINTMLFQIKGAIVLGPRACQLPCAWLWLWIIAHYH